MSVSSRLRLVSRRCPTTDLPPLRPTEPVFPPPGSGTEELALWDEDASWLDPEPLPFADPSAWPPWTGRAERHQDPPSPNGEDAPASAPPETTYRFDNVRVRRDVRPLHLAAQTLICTGPTLWDLKLRLCLRREEAALVVASDPVDRTFLVVHPDDRVYRVGSDVTGMYGWAGKQFACCPGGKMNCDCHGPTWGDCGRPEPVRIRYVEMPGVWNQVSRMKLRPV